MIKTQSKLRRQVFQQSIFQQMKVNSKSSRLTVSVNELQQIRLATVFSIIIDLKVDQITGQKLIIAVIKTLKRRKFQ